MKNTTLAFLEILLFLLGVCGARFFTLVFTIGSQYPAEFGIGTTIFIAFLIIIYRYKKR